jgi:hypothetical protein
MIGDSTLSVDYTVYTSLLNGRHFKGTRGLWELLSRKNFNIGVVTKEDLKRYKNFS